MMKTRFLLFLFLAFSAKAQLIYGPRGGSGGGGGVSGPQTPVVYVATNGNDGTAVIGNPQKPYQTAKAALAATPNNSVVYFFPGTYVVTPSLIISPDSENLTTETAPALTQVTNVMLSGYGATIYGAGEGNLLNLANTYNVTIRGLTFQGTQPSTNLGTPTSTLYAHAYRLRTNVNMTFEDCKFYGYGNHGIASPTMHNTKYQNGLIVRNSHFKDGGSTNVTYSPNVAADGQAIGSDGGDVLIEGNLIENNVRGVEHYGWHLVPTTDFDKTMRNVKIVNNTFRNIKQWGILAISSTGIAATNWSGITIQNNYMENCGIWFDNRDTINGSAALMSRGAMWIGEAANIDISHNTIIRGDRSGIQFLVGTSGDIVEDFVVANNKISGFAQSGLVFERQVSGAALRNGSVTGNKISDCAYYGIYFAGGNNIDVAGNHVTGCGTDGAVAGNGQLRVHAYSGVNASNVVLRANYVGPSALTNGNSAAIVSTDRTDHLTIADNTLGMNYHGVAAAVRLGNTGTLIQEFRMQTTDATATAWFTNMWPTTSRSLTYETEARGWNQASGISSQLHYRGAFTNGIAVGRLGSETAVIILEQNSSTQAAANASANGHQYTVTGVAATTINWLNRIRLFVME